MGLFLLEAKVNKDGCRLRIDLIKDITIWKIFRVSLPLMISALSTHFMLVLDQLVLARYSVDAMVSASSASVWCSTLQLASMSITMIAGSFVGNYNGAGKYKLASVPVWQMIWFSLSLFAISIPLSIYAADVCIPDNLKSEGIPYFRTIMFAAPICGVYYSLSSFFVAIGKGFLVTISVVLANIVNIVFDVILVFGYFGIDHFMGAWGAAIGTVAAVVVNTLFLFICFLSRDIREKYNTTNLKLRLSKMKEYLKLGLAGGFSHMFEMSSWSIIYYLLAKVATEEALIQSIAVSVNLFTAFIVSGLEKGIMALTANLLGAKLRHEIGRVLKKALCIHFLFAAIIAFIFIAHPDLVVNNFIKFDVDPEVVQRAKTILWLVLIYFSIDGIVWIIAGIIEAGGDINYMMITIASCLWVFVTIPDYLLFKVGELSVERTWCLLAVAVVSTATILYHRYKTDKWIHIQV